MRRSGGSSLIEQVAERLGPDGVWEALRPFIPSLQRPLNGKVEVRAICAFHDDHRPSWCWNLAKGVATCHACGQGNTSMVRFIASKTNRSPVAVLDDYCKRFRLPRPKQRILTLPDYATVKCLPLDFLTERFKLADSPEGLRMPYLDRNGAPVADRLRRRIGERPRWVGRGTAARRMVYGLHGVPWMAMTGYVVAVEGESDLHTAWYHDFPALATPGATIGHKALAEAVVEARAHTVYALGDADSAGRVWLDRLDRGLKLAGWTGKLLAARLPTKDLSDLHVEHPDGFDQALSACLHQAQPVADVLLNFERQHAAEDSTMTRLVQQVMQAPGASPTDRVIAIAAALQVACDPSQPLPVTKSKLATLARIERRTLYNRLPELERLGWLVPDGGRLRLGKALVKGV